MAFKLKLKQVQLSGSKASPFKINNALVQGAGIAAKGFTTDMSGGYNDVQMATSNKGMEEEGGSDSGSSEAESKKPTCTEQGLTGDALKQCQEDVNTDFATKRQEDIDAKAKAKADKEAKEKAKQERKGIFGGVFNSKKDKTEEVNTDPAPAPVPEP
jgi:hypothetical protein